MYLGHVSFVDRLGRLQDTFESVTLLFASFSCTCLARPAAVTPIVLWLAEERGDTLSTYYYYKYLTLDWRSPLRLVALRGDGIKVAFSVD